MAITNLQVASAESDAPGRLKALGVCERRIGVGARSQSERETHHVHQSEIDEIIRTDGHREARGQIPEEGAHPEAHSQRRSFGRIRSNQKHQKQSEAHSEALRSTQEHSGALRSTQKHSEALRSTQKHSGAKNVTSDAHRDPTDSHVTSTRGRGLACSKTGREQTTMQVRRDGTYDTRHRVRAL